MVYFQSIERDGTVSTTVYDDGLESSKENPKRLLSILAQVNEYKDDAYVEGWWEREKIFTLPVYLIDTIEEGTTEKIAKSMNRINEIEIGMDLPVGSTFKLAMRCGSDAVNFTGAYRFEITA
ncbi:hypothetical protein ES702_05949 [subsurface metagenome]